MLKFLYILPLILLTGCDPVKEKKDIRRHELVMRRDEYKFNFYRELFDKECLSAKEILFLNETQHEHVKEEKNKQQTHHSHNTYTHHTVGRSHEVH